MKTTFNSRAVVRNVEAGSSAICAACDEQVKFAAKVRRQQVICNVYVNGKWDRVEHYHAECYTSAGEPHGTVADLQVPSKAKAS
jgi:hypothetical protein